MAKINGFILIMMILQNDIFKGFGTKKVVLVRI